MQLVRIFYVTQMLNLSAFRVLRGKFKLRDLEAIAGKLVLPEVVYTLYRMSQIKWDTGKWWVEGTETSIFHEITHVRKRPVSEIVPL